MILSADVSDRSSVCFDVRRYMDLETFVEEAASADAVVWLSLQGGIAAGPLQRILEQFRIPFTGVPLPLLHLFFQLGQLLASGPGSVRV